MWVYPSANLFWLDTGTVFFAGSFWFASCIRFSIQCSLLFLVAALILPPAPYIGFGVILAGRCYFGGGSLLGFCFGRRFLIWLLFIASTFCYKFNCGSGGRFPISKTTPSLHVRCKLIFKKCFTFRCSYFCSVFGLLVFVAVGLDDGWSLYFFRQHRLVLFLFAILVAYRKAKWFCFLGLL